MITFEERKKVYKKTPVPLEQNYLNKLLKSQLKKEIF